MSEKAHILSRLPVQSGIVFGIVPLPVHFFLAPELSYQLAALTLVLIAGIYVGYAFKDGRVQSIIIELSTALAFSATAWLGINGHPSFIILALAMHGLWDLMHHNLIDTEIPRWYIPFCAIVDWVMAASLFIIWNLLH